MTWELKQGHVLDVLRSMDAESVNCCVTSPPYWRQRIYSEDEREIGREESPEEWVGDLVHVFHEMRRVLVPTASFWLNVGDKYAAGGLGGGGMASRRKNWAGTMGQAGWRYPPPGYKPKDLTLTPFELAKALRNDGWYLRQTIIWEKVAAVEPPRHIGPIPGRKGIALYESPGPVLAYFRNEAAARRALAALDRLMPSAS